MTIVVYTTNPAARFHHTRDCTQRTSAQDLSDVDCGCDTHCTHKMPRTHPVLRMELDRALRKGKRPCTYCYRDPSLRQTVMPPSRETFGHEPIEYDGALICASCYVPHLKHRHTVPWPCTSAIVLGLVPRPAAG